MTWKPRIWAIREEKIEYDTTLAHGNNDQNQASRKSSRFKRERVTISSVWGALPTKFRRASGRKVQKSEEISVWILLEKKAREWGAENCEECLQNPCKNLPLTFKNRKDLHFSSSALSPSIPHCTSMPPSAWHHLQATGILSQHHFLVVQPWTNH